MRFSSIVITLLVSCLTISGQCSQFVALKITEKLWFLLFSGGMKLKDLPEILQNF